MESAATAAARPERVRGALLAGLFALAAVAWVATADRMAGMDMGPGTDPGTLGFFVISWLVMMAAMMFPSITPMVLVFARIGSRRRERGAVDEAVSTWIFGAQVDIAAPGVNVFSTFPNHRNRIGKRNYDYGSGTSMATPHVAGAAALVWGPAGTAAEVRARLEQYHDRGRWLIVGPLWGLAGWRVS